MEKVSPRRPRRDDASKKAEEGIRQAEKLGIVPPVSFPDDDTFLDDIEAARETDHRTSSTRAVDNAPAPFKVTG